MPSHFYVPVYIRPLVQNRTASTLGSESNLHLTLSSFGSSFFSSHYISFHQSISPKSKGLYYPLLFLYISYTLYSYILPWSTKLRRPQPCPPVASAPSPSRVRLDLPSPGAPSASTRVPSTRILSWLLASNHRSEAHYCPRPTRLLVPSKSTTLQVLLLRSRLRLLH